MVHSFWIWGTIYDSMICRDQINRDSTIAVVRGCTNRMGYLSVVLAKAVCVSPSLSLLQALLVLHNKAGSPLPQM